MNKNKKKKEKSHVIIEGEIVKEIIRNYYQCHLSESVEHYLMEEARIEGIQSAFGRKTPFNFVTISISRLNILFYEQKISPFHHFHRMSF